MRIDPTTLRVLRRRSGLMQKQVAKAAGMDPTHYSRIEKGERRGTPAQIMAIAAVLKVPVTTILRAEDK